MSRPFRHDLPTVTRGQRGGFIFEVRLRDRSLCDVFGFHMPDGSFRWHECTTFFDLTSQVVAWRETYTCGMARRAIDQLALYPDSVVAQWDMRTALQRHIYFQRTKENQRPACRSCARYVQVRHGPNKRP